MIRTPLRNCFGLPLCGSFHHDHCRFCTKDNSRDIRIGLAIHRIKRTNSICRGTKEGQEEKGKRGEGVSGENTRN